MSHAIQKPAPNRARQDSRPGTKNAWFVTISLWNLCPGARMPSPNGDRPSGRAKAPYGKILRQSSAGSSSLCPKRRAADIRSLKLLFITILIVKRGCKLVKKLLQFREDFLCLIKNRRQNIPAHAPNAPSPARQSSAGSTAACRCKRALPCRGKRALPCRSKHKLLTFRANPI